MFGHASTPARREAQTFILETLRKQEGEGWQQLGQFMLWRYGFDRSGCLLSVEREAELGDLFQQRIPLLAAEAMPAQNSEIIFACRGGVACIDHNIKNRQQTDEQRVPRTRLLIMDANDIPPLLNAFAELQQLCRDPYAPTR